MLAVRICSRPALKCCSVHASMASRPQWAAGLVVRVARHDAAHTDAERHSSAGLVHRRHRPLFAPVACLDVEDRHVLELPDAWKVAATLIAALAAHDDRAGAVCQRVAAARPRQHEDGCLAPHAALGHVRHHARRGLCNAVAAGGLVLDRLLGAIGTVTGNDHLVDLSRCQRWSATDDEQVRGADGHCRCRCPRVGQPRGEHGPHARRHIEELDRRLRLRAPEHVVAATNGCQVAITLERHDAGAGAGDLQRRARHPPVRRWIVDLAALQRLHEGLARLSVGLQRAAADDVDLAAQRRASVAPARARERRHALLPGLLVGVVDVAARKQPLRDALLVVPPDDHHAAIRQQGRGATGSSRRHRCPLDPAAVPRVEHLHLVQGPLRLVPAAEGVEHVRQRSVETEEGGNVLGIERGRQSSAPGRRRRAPSSVV
mmetsp:Transcript_47100/g.121759  ORF Transcript_47100/g.121759 Transcript_47100/m.121759 type:complete len:431 (-) Transcript_47100:334-1626(-)